MKIKLSTSQFKRRDNSSNNKIKRCQTSTSPLSFKNSNISNINKKRNPILRINKVEIFDPKNKEQLNAFFSPKKHKRNFSSSSNYSYSSSKRNSSNLSFTSATSKKTNRNSSFSNYYQMSCENLINKVRCQVVDKFHNKNNLYQFQKYCLDNNIHNLSSFLTNKNKELTSSNKSKKLLRTNSQKLMNLNIRLIYQNKDTENEIIELKKDIEEGNLTLIKTKEETDYIQRVLKELNSQSYDNRLYVQEMSKKNNKLLIEKRNLFNEIILMKNKIEKLKSKLNNLLKLHNNIKIRLNDILYKFDE